MKFDTKLIHGGAKHTFPNIFNIIEPVFLSSVYRFVPGEEKETPHVIPYKYGREDNPTVVYLERKISELEGGVDALAFSSGIASINCILTLLVKKDCTIVAPLDLYGSTVILLRKYANLYNCKLIETDPGTENILNALHNLENVKSCRVVVLVESVSNPLLRVYDIEEIAKICKENTEKGVETILVVDNTIPTMYSLKPIEHGASITVYSATKYLSGHNDVVGGFAIFTNKVHAEQAWDIRRLQGTIMEPFTAYLIDRGLKTLHVRMRKHEENARAVAEFLQDHPKVAEVIFPGFSNHKDFKLACKYLKCLSGMVSFRVKGGLEEALRVCKNVKLIVPGVSFGGTESIITHPYTTTHRYLSADEKRRVGITENLLRLSVGLEDPEDIVEDIDQALRSSVP